MLLHARQGSSIRRSTHWAPWVPMPELSGLTEVSDLTDRGDEGVVVPGDRDIARNPKPIGDRRHRPDRGQVVHGGDGRDRPSTPQQSGGAAVARVFGEVGLDDHDLGLEPWCAIAAQ